MVEQLLATDPSSPPPIYACVPSLRVLRCYNAPSCCRAVLHSQQSHCKLSGSAEKLSDSSSAAAADSSFGSAVITSVVLDRRLSGRIFYPEIVELGHRTSPGAPFRRLQRPNPLRSTPSNLPPAKCSPALRSLTNA